MAEPNKLAYIYSVRGWAILGVIFVHSMSLVWPGRFIENVATGARGVQMFYLVSAFTLFLSHSLRSQEELNPIRNFYIRRFFRVVPGFYVAVIGYLFLFGLGARYWAPAGVSWTDILLTMTFLNGWKPDAINAVIPVGWSVPIEVTFYLLFPFLYRYVDNLRKAGWWLLATTIGGILISKAGMLLLKPIYPGYLLDWFFELWFPAELPVFIIGIGVYHIIRSQKIGRSAAILMMIASVYLAGGLALGEYRLLPRHILFSLVFAMFFIALSAYPARVFVNLFTMWLGRLSYCMYLVHIAVIEGIRSTGFFARMGAEGVGWFLLAYLVCLALTLGVSQLAYTTIEAPMIRLGRRQIEWLEQRERAAVPIQAAA